MDTRTFRSASRGAAHFNADHPETDARFEKDTVTVFGEPPHLGHE